MSVPRPWKTRSGNHDQPGQPAEVDVAGLQVDHGATDYIDADLRDTGKILQIAGRTIDFSEPVAVMLIAVLHLIRDEDNPRQIIDALMAAVPPGSSLSISHVPNDMHMGQMSDTPGGRASPSGTW